MNTPKYKKQKGAVLIVTLAMLILLTILALATAKNAVFRERISGNARNVDLALQAAEAGLRVAENSIMNNQYLTDKQGYQLLDQENLDAAKVYLEDKSFDSGAFYEITKSDDVSVKSDKATQYVIVQYPSLSSRNEAEETTLGDPSDQIKEIFRIYTRGYGADGRTAVVLTTTIRK